MIHSFKARNSTCGISIYRYLYNYKYYLNYKSHTFSTILNLYLCFWKVKIQNNNVVLLRVSNFNNYISLQMYLLKSSIYNIFLIRVLLNIFFPKIRGTQFVFMRQDQRSYTQPLNLFHIQYYNYISKSLKFVPRVNTRQKTCFLSQKIQTKITKS